MKKNKPTVLGYMRDQPRALVETFKNRAEFINPFEEIFIQNNIRKILFFGSGTSYNASNIAAYYFKHIVGIDASANYPTVFENYEKPDWTSSLKSDEILFVGISQSGTSISTVNVMDYATKHGFHTVALTENLESEITKHAKTVIHLLCGKEETPPETRGYTVTLLQLYLWAIAAAHATGKINDSEFRKYEQAASDLADQFDTVISESEEWFDRNITAIANSDRLYVLGYGIDYGSALEGMLKMGEMLRLPAIGYELEEYSHGPTMAISRKQSILMIGSEEKEWKRCLKFRKVFKQYTDRVFLITCQDTPHDDRDVVFSVKTNKYLAPIMYTVPFQFVAAKGALLTNIDTGINPFEIELSHIPG